MTTVRPVVHTDHPERYVRLLGALGGVSVVHELGWDVLEFAQGRIAVQAPVEGLPPGTLALNLEMEDLDEWAARRGHGEEDLPGGRAVPLGIGDGVVVRATLPTSANSAAGGPTSLLPIWMTADVAGAVSLLESAGLEVMERRGNGRWVQLRSDDGLVAVHAPPEDVDTGMHLSFLHAGDVEALVPALQEVGTDPRIVDGPNGRTLRLANPDGGERLWVHERGPAE